MKREQQYFNFPCQKEVTVFKCTLLLLVGNGNIVWLINQLMTAGAFKGLISKTGSTFLHRKRTKNGNKIKDHASLRVMK